MPNTRPKPNVEAAASRSVSRRELLDLAEQIMAEARLAKEKPRGYVHPSRVGSARDPAMQGLAAIGLNHLRRNGASLEAIGALLGVSRERVRQLEKRLLDDYAEEAAAAAEDARLQNTGS